MMGYQPQLFRCLGCDSPIQPGENHFSTARGGVLCPQCGRLDSASVPITTGALKLMRNLQSHEESILGLGQIDAAIAREAEMRLRDYIGLRLERMPRAVAFLERLRTESASA
jgi:DNA repair protein RecO (recombination protein O)